MTDGVVRWITPCSKPRIPRPNACPVLPMALRPVPPRPPQIDPATLKSGTRVTLDMTTNTIMRALPREVDPQVFSMLNEDPGNVSFSSVGGLSEQIRELREVIELPLTNPELFKRVGIKPPKARRRGVARALPASSTPLCLLRRAFSSTAPPARARRCSRVPSHVTSMRPSSRWGVCDGR